MNFLLFLSEFIIPLIIFYIVGFALLMKINAYEEFIEGAKNGFKTVFDILPTLIGLMLGIGILRSSGFLDFLSHTLSYVFSPLGLPSSVVPIIIVKMFSSSAATGLLIDLFKEYGPDSLAGFMASIALSSSETIFYTMSVYFIAAGVKKSRWTLPGALLATLFSTIASVAITHFIFQ